jgi:DNA damage-binding protein 1
VSINRFSFNPVSLREVSSFASTFVAQHLHVTPVSRFYPEERLVVGDGMRSIFVLEIDAGSGEVFGDQRDAATYQVLAMGGVKDGGKAIVISDVRRRQPNVMTTEGRRATRICSRLG